MLARNGINVLLIEDSITDANLIIAELGMVDELPIRVQHADSYEEAVKIIAEESFDAAILDLNLPDSHGLTTYRNLRDKAPDTPIIVFTGNDDRAQAVEALNAGADSYLFKNRIEGKRIATAILASMARRNPSD